MRPIHVISRRPFAALIDLVVPEVCGGCGTPGPAFCPRCRALLADVPTQLRPRVPIPATAWALGPYRSAHRESIIAMKEHGRRDLARPLGAVVARGLIELHRWSELPDRRRLCLVPAPTKASAARRRGGDHVTAVCAHAAADLGPSVRVAPVLRTRALTRDSAGLDAAQRSRNLAGAVRIVRPRATAPPDSDSEAVVLIDDVLTTGATAAESIAVLAAAGASVHAVLVIAGA